MMQPSVAEIGHVASRSKRVMFGLLYPAVLGTLFVTLLPATAAAFQTGLELKGIVAWLLVAHFVLDYIYAEEIRGYRGVNFLVDLGIVMLVYWAFSNVHLGDGEPVGVQRISWAMVFVYFGFLLWHYLLRDKIGTYWVLTIYEATAMLWFLFAAVFIPTKGVVLAVGLAVAATGLCVVGAYVLHGYYHKASLAKSTGDSQ